MRRYPFDRLPRVSSQVVPLLRTLTAHVGADASDIARRWGRECLGAADFSVRVVSAVPRFDEPLASRLEVAERFALEGPPTTQLVLAMDGAVVSELARRIARVTTGGGAGATRGERGLVAHGLAWLLASLSSGTSWRLREEAPALKDYREALLFTLQLETRAGGFTAWLLVYPGVLAALPASAPTPRTRPSWWRDLPVSLPVELARLNLGAGEIGALSAGDIIVAEPLPSSIEGATAWVAVGEGMLVGQIHDGSLTVEGWERDQPWRAARSAADQEVQRMAGEAADLVDGLELEVVVELARVKLEAGGLAELVSGDVLQLGRPLVAPLELRVGGRLIARGELVDVDGEAGLRIIEVAQ
ncbi:MAG: hypothetical protein CSA65_03140 [Proteobacteria bacterium]|nr:MAG: hypothetical protein CSA65_03140 [Pseudomonadota bacterium]